uniref:Uncharacterized protein n=1 Tax=Setaria viridis TaxID=4556 RepID=A0A4U6U590_SETVI|nr:hypothetical protein SEVIR_6G052050v2 [Setaria viridis]
MLDRKLMVLAHSSVVHRGGRMVYWLAKNILSVLVLEKLKLVVANVPQSRDGQKFTIENTLLGLSREGRLCAVQFSHLSLVPGNRLLLAGCKYLCSLPLNPPMYQ